jgi:mannose-6-phosphate isomerase-like protein (cupin superfamily)
MRLQTARASPRANAAKYRLTTSATLSDVAGGVRAAVSLWPPHAAGTEIAARANPIAPSVHLTSVSLVARGCRIDASMAGEPVSDPIVGEGYAVANVDGIGEQYGFRKIRRELGVTAFGMNAIAMPPGYESGRHFHDEQEETYFVHRGTVEMEFGDGSKHVLGPGGLARVDAATVRMIRNVGDGDALYVCVGGKDGYVGRDGRMPEGEENPRGGPPGAA